MIKTEEKIVRINRRKQGEEVRVYQTFDKETGKPIGGSRFTHLHEKDSEEVKMVPVENDIETLRLEQSLWLLDFPESLDTKLKLKGSINVEDALLPKEWLNSRNWRFYLVQMIERIEYWKKKNGPYDIGTEQTLLKLKEEISYINDSDPKAIFNGIKKLKAPLGLKKLESLFKDFERQEMLAIGSKDLVKDHFTESARKEKIPKEAKLIVWIAKLYELRFFIRSLRNASWIDAKLEDTASHFIFEGQTVSLAQLRSGKIGTEDLSNLSSVLSLHQIPCA
tara:strand:- start:503 stop:1339 length:837 start_codon:yes stop_codon:yes gene_type:complete